MLVHSTVLPVKANPSYTAYSFRTERIVARNCSTDRAIVGYLDIPVRREPCGAVIIAPAYGESKENNLLISSYFAANGYYGLRFDWTDHVGESQGDIFVSTLGKMRTDLSSLLDFVRTRFTDLQVGLVATSLGARVALKFAAENTFALDFLVCFAPVVNLRSTLKTVYREDLVAFSSEGKRYGILNILGFRIDADMFLSDCRESGFSDLASTVSDASRIHAATFFLLGQRDSWVHVSEARAVFEALRRPERNRLSIVPTMMHRPLENASSAKDMLLDAAGFVANLDGFRKQSHSNLVAPEEAEVSIRLHSEKQHLKQLYAYSKSEERTFWKEYLRNFQYIINIHDFFNLLECMYENLGGVWPGQKILDAGCGIGNFGLFLLTKQLYKLQQDPQLLSRDSAHYVGVDFIETANLDARMRMGQLLAEYREKISTRCSTPIVRSSFVRADLDGGLPFSSDCFDQICCNLVLSYVQKPDFVLRELWRVLRPGSKMVISSLKPSADLSEVYRNFVSVAETPEELEQGRKLLNNAGMIKLKEVRGLYHFYGTKELKAAVREAGFIRAKAMLSFGDQASVVVCFKA